MSKRFAGFYAVFGQTLAAWDPIFSLQVLTFYWISHNVNVLNVWKILYLNLLLCFINRQTSVLDLWGATGQDQTLSHVTIRAVDFLPKGGGSRPFFKLIGEVDPPVIHKVHHVLCAHIENAHHGVCKRTRGACLTAAFIDFRGNRGFLSHTSGFDPNKGKREVPPTRKIMIDGEC